MKRILPILKTKRGKGRYYPYECTEKRSDTRLDKPAWKNFVAKDVIGTAKESLLSTHPDQPRASSRINDNYYVNFVHTGLLAGSNQEPPKKTINSYCSKTLVNSFVVNPVLAAPGPSHRKGVSSGVSVI